MAKLIVCREVGFDCDAEVRAETVDEALAIAAAHVTRDHGIDDVTPDLVQVVVARIHDVPGGAPAAGLARTPEFVQPAPDSFRPERSRCRLFA